MRQSIPGWSLCWVRRLLTFVLCLFIAFALALLALRYVASPRVDHWRPQIASFLTGMLGVTVELGPLRADWRGWDPGLGVEGLRLRATDGSELLALASVRARLDWRALLPGTRAALRLEVHGMDFGVDRMPDGRLSLLGVTIDPTMTSAPALPGWLQWVLAQPLIAFHDVKVRWHDEMLGAPPLLFDDVEAIWTHHLLGGAAFQASARTAAAGGARVQLRARAPDIAAVLDGRWPAQGIAWLQVTGFQPRRWRPWIPQIPAQWLVGSLQGQAWLQAGRAGPRLTLQGQLEGLDWAGPGLANLYLPDIRAWVQGPLVPWFGAGSPGGAKPALAFELRASGSQLYLPQWFASTLHLGELSLRGRVPGGDRWRLQVDEALWHNTDVTLQGHGSWTPGGAAGVADFSGTIERASLAAIHRYLPLAVDADARSWLADGLQAGELVQGTWRVEGDLDQFPFGEQPQSGDFSVAGDFHDARIDLVPDATGKLSWPLLQVGAGRADLRRMDLRLTATQARMDPEAGQSIALSGVQARIPDMEHDATLSVSGHSVAPGDAYMSLIRHSPLARLLGGVFDQARADGQWQVPLALTVPLLHTDDIRVQGRVDLQQAGLQFLPQAPAFQNLDGAVHFSEEGLSIAQPLKGRLLGGTMQVQGELGSAATPGLTFRGRMTAQAIGRFVDLPGMKRLDGSLDYQAHLRRNGNAYAFLLNSDTAALALDFPAPLAKPAGEKRALTLRWTDADPREDTLDITYGDSIRVALRHQRASTRGAYFHQAGVGLGEAAPSSPGLAIGIRYPLVDLDLWNRLLDEFSVVRRSRASTTRRSIWPDLALLSVQADQLRLLGTRMDGAVLRAVGAAGEHWSLNVRSRQTTGTLKWQEQGGRVQGHVSGRFSRLSLGDDPRDRASLLPEAREDQGDAFDEDLEIPGIVLQADEFDLYGRPLGALSLEGERDASQHSWKLSRLRIGAGQTTLQGTGTWRLRGTDRGLTLNASVRTDNLGTWMEHAGWPDMIVGGSGDLKGRFEWRNLPWSHDKADLKGELQLALDKGSFPKLGSRTAKLLELLSLQSITRLARLDRGLSGLLHEGIPFDQLRGAASLDKGQAQVRDYKLIGPIGTILLEGSANILQETLDMQAVVVPNLDVSGAAIAAGIAINPVVGLGAFITQWLLKTPLAKAMTAHYRITGTWDDPKVSDVPVEAPARADSGPQER